MQRLIPAFRDAGMTLKLVHIGSWGNEPQRPREERIGELEVSDISAYPSGSFEAVLDIERPDAVIMLSTATFAHRAFLRYCKQRSIPTLHLYHGLMGMQVTDDHRGSSKINLFAHIPYVFARIGKLLRRTFPCYINALLRTHADARDWLRFAYDTFKLAIGMPIWQPNAAQDASTTKCAVFTEIDREHAHRVYRIPFSDVHAVGYPDLMSFGFSQGLLASYRADGSDRERQEIVYLDTGLVTAGLAFRDEQDFVGHLERTSVALRAQGFSMCLKAHPAHNQKVLTALLAQKDIELISTQELIPRLQQCAACLVEISSVNLVPALMGIPLLYGNYDQLAELRFGPVLRGYPRGFLVKNISEVRGILEYCWKRRDGDVLNGWIRENSGPMPPEDMPRRVGDLVGAMIDSIQREPRNG